MRKNVHLSIIALVAGICLPGSAAASEPGFQFESMELPPVYDTRSPRDLEYGRAAAIADFNGDELPDIFIGHGAGQNDVLMLQSLEEKWIVSPLDSTVTEPSFAALAVDLNRDFAPDLVVARPSGTWIYLNRGGSLRRVGKLPAKSNRIGGGVTQALVAADLTGDGWIDLFETRTDGSAGDGDRLWINTGELNHGRPGFREESTERGTDLCCVSAGAVLHDIEGDGDQDIIIASTGTLLSLLVNDGSGNFATQGIPIIDGTWKSVVTGDIDNDGDVDLLVAGRAADESESSVRLLTFNEGIFSDVSKDLGVMVTSAATGAVFVDNDMDGLIDISIASSADTGVFAKPVRYLRNDPITKRFENVSASITLEQKTPMQMLVADVNRDGMPDQLVLADHGKSELLVNRQERANWLGVVLRGRNDAAVAGTRVRLRMQDGTHLHRHLRIGEGLGMDAEDTLLFGFGRRSAITVMEVYWPSGKHTRIDGPDFNRHIGLLEPSDENVNDVSMKYPALGLVESLNKRMRADPSLREKIIRPQPRHVCR